MMTSKSKKMVLWLAAVSGLLVSPVASAQTFSLSVPIIGPLLDLILSLVLLPLNFISAVFNAIF